MTALVSSREITASGHDLHTLLFSFLDEVLFMFLTEFLVFKELQVTQLDTENWVITASG